MLVGSALDASTPPRFGPPQAKNIRSTADNAPTEEVSGESKPDGARCIKIWAGIWMRWLLMQTMALCLRGHGRVSLGEVCFSIAPAKSLYPTGFGMACD